MVALGRHPQAPLPPHCVPTTSSSTSPEHDTASECRPSTSTPAPGSLLWPWPHTSPAGAVPGRPLCTWPWTSAGTLEGPLTPRGRGRTPQEPGGGQEAADGITARLALQQAARELGGLRCVDSATRRTPPVNVAVTYTRVQLMRASSPSVRVLQSELPSGCWRGRGGIGQRVPCRTKAIGSEPRPTLPGDALASDGGQQGGRTARVTCSPRWDSPQNSHICFEQFLLLPEVSVGRRLGQSVSSGRLPTGRLAAPRASGTRLPRWWCFSYSVEMSFLLMQYMLS